MCTMANNIFDSIHYEALEFRPYTLPQWLRDGVRVWCIPPGFLATGLGGAGAEVPKKMGAGDPATVGPFILSVLQGDRDADSGKVITKDSIQEG